MSVHGMDARATREGRALLRAREGLKTLAVLADRHPCRFHESLVGARDGERILENDEVYPLSIVGRATQANRDLAKSAK